MTEQPRRSNKRAVLLVHPPVDQPPPFEPIIVAGIRALSMGTASEHQQRTVFEWIYKDLAGIGSQSFRTGDSHQTAFMEGRRFVGVVLVNLANEKVNDDG